jgi:hypothetical protein
MALEACQEAANPEAEIDEVWCVFDVEWPKNDPDVEKKALKEAVEEARKGGVKLAISNPCFELWLILHFQDQSSSLNNEQACKLRSKFDRSPNKGINPRMYERYMDNIGEAARRAKALDKRHEQDDTAFPHNNPSSGMYRLLASLGALNGAGAPDHRGKGGTK